MATPSFQCVTALPGDAAHEHVALFVLLILFVANTLCFLQSNNNPFYLSGVTVYMGVKKRHLVSWCGASVRSGFPEILSLSSFQEDANFKIGSTKGFLAIQHLLMLVGKVCTQAVVKPSLP